MKRKFFNSKSPEQAANGTAALPLAEGVEEIVIYDECGDTLWDKVLAQDELAGKLKQQLQK